MYHNVQFVLSHSVVTTAVGSAKDLGRDEEMTEEEIIEEAKQFLAWDGIDVSRAQDIQIEEVF